MEGLGHFVFQATTGFICRHPGRWGQAQVLSQPVPEKMWLFGGLDDDRRAVIPQAEDLVVYIFYLQVFTRTEYSNCNCWGLVNLHHLPNLKHILTA